MILKHEETLSSDAELGLFVDPNRIRPLPQDLWGSPCSNCGNTHSRWTMLDTGPGSTVGASKEAESVEREPRPIVVCALCFLYDSVWGQRRRAELDKFLIEMEAQENRSREAKASQEQSVILTPSGSGTKPPPFTFTRDADGRLSAIKEADAVLARLALFSKLGLQEAVKAQAQASASSIVLPRGGQFRIKA